MLILRKYALITIWILTLGYTGDKQFHYFIIFYFKKDPSTDSLTSVEWTVLYIGNLLHFSDVIGYATLVCIHYYHKAFTPRNEQATENHKRSTSMYLCRILLKRPLLISSTSTFSEHYARGCSSCVSWKTAKNKDMCSPNTHFIIREPRCNYNYDRE
jgi:hypothetical protein